MKERKKERNTSTGYCENDERAPSEHNNRVVLPVFL